MTAKEFLKQYEEADRRAQRCRAEYEREHDLIDSVKSTLDTDGMPRGSGVSKSVEDRAIRLADKAMCWKVAQLDALEKRQEVFELIHGIEGIEGDVLYEKYIKLRTWEDIADTLHYSVRGVQYAHGRALLIVTAKLT